MPISWRANPERAIQTMVAQLGEPWASTSFVWFFSAKHGLEFDEHKRWTGKIIDGKLYARIVFITERALNAAEAGALTNETRGALNQDASISRRAANSSNGHVDRASKRRVGDIPTIGW
jgi:hypothetical protein